MRDDIVLNGWLVRGKSSGFGDPFFESLFFTGNGRMGLRGYVAGEPAARPAEKGLFVAGMFAGIKPGITDLVNLPTPAWHRLLLGGEPGIPEGGVTYTLDLACGLLTQQYTLLAGGARVAVTEQRFFDPDRPALLAQRLTLCSDRAITAVVITGLFSASCNRPVPDDQVKESTETVQLMAALGAEFVPGGLTARYRARATGLELVQQLLLRQPAAWQAEELRRPGEAWGYTFTGELRPGRAACFDKLCGVYTSRDKDPLLAPLPARAGFDELLAQARSAWQARWQESDLRIEGDKASEAALRYCVYQLMANCSPRDDTVSIGARGLTHTRYKGCYFWDTDLFMMPFYLLTHPQAAQSLERYRVGCLPAARAHAQKMNGAGARYPWMAAFDGSEQCESWDIGASEVHITADVVFALEQYLQISGDQALAPAAREVYVETARFWASRCTPDPAGGYNLLFCKGPDEYCGITSNNLFTGWLVRHNLRLALAAARYLQSQEPARWQALSLSEQELQGWQALHDGLKLPKDPLTGHWRTDDTFHLLEPVDPAGLKQGSEASYHRVCFDRLQRYRVIKQADVLLLMTRLPQDFTPQEKLAAWQEFEPLCLHDSTLSFATHALFAAQNGLAAAAWSYFEKALYLDLRDIMGNTGKEGLHLACLGESWQAVVFGFAGLHFTPDGPRLAPHLPQGWKCLRFRFYWHGVQYEARVTPEGGDCRPRQTGAAF
ncbi:glycosyl hydrolase family 65 protein [Allofournierella sp.]|uniref:glycosyl hydrolase family 65 protein n=1 Tax=Allofournierella sp. TaxID=1940256 RepID=UPI003AB1A7E2